MTFATFVDLARTLAVRAFTADFQRERAMGAERAELLTAEVPVADALAQDYVAWRRAALWVAAVLLSLGALLALFELTPTAEQMAAGAAGGAGGDAAFDASVRQIEQAFGAGNLALIDGLQGFLLFVKFAVAALAVAAAWQWLRIGRSRLLTRCAWLAALVVPLLISAWPWGQALDFSHLDQNGWATAGQGAAAKQQVSVALGAMLLITVAPKLIALFPGIMRSSLALKTLLPQAAAPGWLTVVFAPFLVGFLLLILSFLSQVQGSWVLIAAVGCLVVGPAVYIRGARELVRPHSDAEVGGVVRGMRRRAMGFHLAGGALLFFYLIGVDSLSWLTASTLVLEAVGGIMLTMVAISDVTLALLAYGHRQGAMFHASDLRDQHEQRLEALAAAGLTDVREAFAMPGQPVHEDRPPVVDQDALATIPSMSMLETRPTSLPRSTTTTR